MKDCKEHYKEMYQARMLEADCPWCIINQLRTELVNAKQEVALDCALMAESDYSTADVAIEIREKYGLPDATYGEIL